MTKKLIKISENDLKVLCWAFHKATRTSDCTKNLDLWNAINALEGNNYALLMDNALLEIGIKVDYKKAKN